MIILKQSQWRAVLRGSNCVPLVLLVDAGWAGGRELHHFFSLNSAFNSSALRRLWGLLEELNHSFWVCGPDWCWASQERRPTSLLVTFAFFSLQVGLDLSYQEKVELVIAFKVHRLLSLHEAQSWLWANQSNFWDSFSFLKTGSCSLCGLAASSAQPIASWVKFKGLSLKSDILFLFLVLNNLRGNWSFLFIPGDLLQSLQASHLSFRGDCAAVGKQNSGILIFRCGWWELCEQIHLF